MILIAPASTRHIKMSNISFKSSWSRSSGPVMTSSIHRIYRVASQGSLSAKPISIVSLMVVTFLVEILLRNVTQLEQVIIKGEDG
jgi:hypothetical protein